MSNTAIQRRFKVAAVQASPVVGNAPHWFDVTATLDKATIIIAEAARNGALLVVFPETWLPCYPYWGFDYSDRTTYRDLWAAYLENSIEVPGKETEILCKVAKDNSVFIAMGINECDKKYQGRMYNSIIYVSPLGELLGTHRKICNTHVERLFHTAGDGGDNLKTVYKTGLGHLGGTICGEHSQLELMYNWIMQGIQLHCSLWPGLLSTRTETDISSRAFCLAAHAFGIISATYFKESDLPQNFYKNSYFNIRGSFCGGSGIVSPFGTYISGPVYDEETIIYGDVDLSDANKARFAVNLTGAYSRWDLFTLQTRQEAYEPITKMNNESELADSNILSHITELEARISSLEQHVINLSSKREDGKRNKK
jgi:nitrilase